LGKRLVKSPKVYGRDTGLLHALLGIGSVAQLQGHPVVGASWEGMVVEHVAPAVPTGSEVNFYRTAAGAEIDVAVTMGDKRIGFEAKFSSAPKPSRSFWQSSADIGLQHSRLVAPVRQAYPIGSHTSVIGLTDILRVIKAHSLA
jgi:predicted AAA+ superfamily ATPase